MPDCPVCGKRITKESNYCNRCGNDLKHPSNQYHAKPDHNGSDIDRLKLEILSENYHTSMQVVVILLGFFIALLIGYLTIYSTTTDGNTKTIYLYSSIFLAIATLVAWHFLSNWLEKREARLSGWIGHVETGGAIPFTLSELLRGKTVDDIPPAKTSP